MRALRAGIGAVDARVAAAFRPRMTALEAVMTGAAASIVPLADGRAAARPRAEALLDLMGCAPWPGAGSRPCPAASSSGCSSRGR